LFPGDAVSSNFFDGVVGAYSATLVEALLGLGGFALVGLIVLAGIKLLAVLPSPQVAPPLRSKSVAVTGEEFVLEE
jgi:Ni/Fe-hydrogenase subunit HybB-like protein